MNFKMVGKLKLGKETEKFKPYQEVTYSSGWANRILNFSIICGDNRHNLNIKGGTYPNKSDYKIVTFGPSGYDDNRKFIPGTRLDIPWKDRLSNDVIEKVSQNRRYVLDLDKRGRRTKLQHLLEKINGGENISDSELESAEIDNPSKVAEALEESNKKRFEFISLWDYAQKVKEVLEENILENKKVYVEGTIEKQYSDANQRWYESYVPQRIYLADDNEKEYSTGTATIYFNNHAVDDGSVDENGKYYVKGFTFEYDSTRKKNIPCPIQLVVLNAEDNSDEKAKGKSNILIKRFYIDDDVWMQYGVTFDMLNGAQKIEITEDMLTDAQREDLEYEIITMDDIRKELGSSIYGDRVQEWRFIKPSRGYTKGPQDTKYTDDDFVIPPIKTAADDEELFDEDDDF